MDERDELAERFEKHRPRLRAVAYRMLGSATEADDAVQETWIRLSRSDAGAIQNLEAWLVTAVGRVALNLLRSRSTRREEPLDGHLPDPVVGPVDGPEDEAVLADSVGLALLVVLETLTPAERLAYVLHDMFSVPFDEIAGILDRTPEAVRQLASRGRRRIRDTDTAPDTDTEAAPAAQRAIVEAFLAASRHGDFEALVAVLDRGVVVREDRGAGVLEEYRGAETISRRAYAAMQLGLDGRLVLVDGRPGFVSWLDGQPYAVATITVRDGRIAAMDILLDRTRLSGLDLSAVDPRR